MRKFVGQYEAIPERTKETLTRYADHHIATGGFLYAVLTNDLFSTMARADEGNREALWLICLYIYNEMPSECWGDSKKVDNWLSIRSTP